MVIIITGASHTGKTVLAQKLLETYHYPYLSVDHLKMGLIRSGNTDLTPEDDEELVDEEHRRGRIALLIALAGGLVLGCLVALFVLFCPLPAPDADWSAIAKSVEFLKEWKWILLLPVAACAVSLGLLLVNRKETL